MSQRRAGLTDTVSNGQRPFVKLFVFFVPFSLFGKSFR